MTEAREVSIITLRIDEETKKQATEVFRSLGLNFNSGIEVYLRKVAREEAIPFDLTLAEK